ncbi:hypothetical protein MFIFM68171_04732 [Madurella fahalii]|uniref:Piwi domain-containing protein n=1 Tax=Madurella fahalii TaxID=1157608 RepID=A0ABQ0G9T5_9PEZI
MSYDYSYVIPYTADSNFDDIAVHEVLQEYLEDQHKIKFMIVIARNRTPQIKTTRPLTHEMERDVKRLVNKVARSSGYYC